MTTKTGNENGIKSSETAPPTMPRGGIAGYECIKEFYKISEETGRETKYTQVLHIFDNRPDLDKWLEKVTPLNTYHVHYGYNTIKEL